MAMYIFKKWGLVITMAVFAGCGLQAQSFQKNEQVTITNFKVYEKNDKQVVEWNAADSVDAYWWKIQGSVDGTTFTTVAIVLGADPQQPGTYRYTEKIKKWRRLLNYYRLCQVDPGGTELISKIIQPAK